MGSNECTETFEPKCKVCQEYEDCENKPYKIETRGEGSMGRFGCTYPKEYQYVDDGADCPPLCTSCSCTRWDGKNYSNCRLVTKDRPCNGYCVKCEEDGQTAMPGFYTTHSDECAKYEKLDVETALGADVKVTDDQGSYAVLSVVGQLVGWAEASKFQDEATIVLSQGKSVILNGADIVFMDENAVGAFMSVLKLARSLGLQFVLASFSQNAKQTLQLTRMDKAIKYFDSVTEAVNFVLKETSVGMDGGVAFVIGEEDPVDFAVHGFAAVGLGFLLYGAYKHYCVKSEEDHVQLEMA